MKTPGPLVTAWALRTGDNPARLLAEARERNRLWRAAACRANQAAEGAGDFRPFLAAEVAAAVSAVVSDWWLVVRKDRPAANH